MKFNQTNAPQGSFGIPPRAKEAAEKFKEAKLEEEKRAEQLLDEPIEDERDFVTANATPEELEEKAREEALPKDEFFGTKNPIEVLAKMGAALEDEDYHKIVFRGFLEKEINIMPAMGKNQTRPLMVLFRTLNGQEYDLVDELIAEDLRDTRMTQQGYDTRRSMWILTFGVVKMDGKVVCQPVLIEGAKGKQIVDAKATARRKREYLGLMHPAILSKMIKYHTALTLAINEIVSTPDAEYLKKP